MTALAPVFGMLKVGLSLQDDTAPRTEYWERFLRALKQSAFFAESGPRILIPCEDTAIETNWPRYGVLQARMSEVNRMIYRKADTFRNTLRELLRAHKAILIRSICTSTCSRSSGRRSCSGI